jgi:subfamily B ATP-binding cassette protein MsbA
VRRVFWSLIWPRRKLLGLGLFLVAISRLAALVLPAATRVVIDDVLPVSDIGKLKVVVAVVALAVVIQAVSSFSLTMLLSVEAHRLIRDLRVRLQAHVLRLPVSYFDNNQSGALVSRVISDVEGVRNLVGTGLVQIIGGVITAVGAFILLLRINVPLTLGALVPLVLFAFITSRAFRKIRPIFRDRGKIRAEVTGRLTEAVSGVRIIKGFHAEEREIGVFRDGAHRMFDNVRKSLTATSLVTSSAGLLMGFTSLAIMGFGGMMIMNGTQTIGDFVAFTLYLAFLIAPIAQMANIGTQFTEAFAGLDRMEELLNEVPEGAEPTRVHTLKGIAGNMRFEDVTFAYESDTEVIRGVSFDAPAGSVTAFVGSSGSGKTTLAGLAAAYLKPQSGTVYLDDRDLTTVKLDSYRSRLGVVLQDDFLFEGTIRENVLFARPGATDEDVRHAVDTAYVNEFTDRFDDGLETVIGERGVKLSGGQRQRVAIARAVLADPRVLILDEATSSLDTESEALIQKSLRQLMKGRTTFVIAHRLSTIQNADQILVVEQGRIVERGRHDDLVDLNGRYQELYTVQARI